MYFLPVLLLFTQVHTFSDHCLQTLSARQDTTQTAYAMAQTAAGLEPRAFWLNPRPVRAEFMVEKLPMAKDFLRVLRLLTVKFTPPKLSLYILIHSRH